MPFNFYENDLTYFNFYENDFVYHALEDVDFVRISAWNIYVHMLFIFTIILAKQKIQYYLTRLRIKWEECKIKPIG